MNVGMTMPATMGWKYLSSSCRPRKYQGALDGFGVRFGFASSRSGALISEEKISIPANKIAIAMNSSISKCGHVCTRSPCSRSTRWMPSGGTIASRRCLSGAPFFGVGMLPVGSGASRTAAVIGAAATATEPPMPGAAAAAGGAARGGCGGRCRARSSSSAGRRGGARLCRVCGLFFRVLAAVGADGGATRTPLRDPAVGPGGRLRIQRLLVGAHVLVRLFPGHLQRPRDPAVLTDAPEVDREEQHQHERQREHVQYVPAQQGVGRHDRAAEEQEVGLLRDER